MFLCFIGNARIYCLFGFDSPVAMELCSGALFQLPLLQMFFPIHFLDGNEKNRIKF